MMREADHNQRVKSQGELVPDRKPIGSSSTPMSSNIPLMAMTPISVSNVSNASNYLKDLGSSFDPIQPGLTASFPTIPTSQTMPSLLRPASTLTPQQAPIVPVRPPMNFSSTSNTTDLTSSLMNNINSLGSRTQTSPSGMPMNTMNASMSTTYFSPPMSNNTNTLFQPPPPPGSTIVKGSSPSVNTTSRPKTAASELDDLFN